MFELVPDDFDVPARPEHARFRLRPLTVEAAVRAWISSAWPFERVTFAERDR